MYQWQQHGPVWTERTTKRKRSNTKAPRCRKTSVLVRRRPCGARDTMKEYYVHRYQSVLMVQDKHVTGDKVQPPRAQSNSKTHTHTHARYTDTHTHIIQRHTHIIHTDIRTLTPPPHTHPATQTTPTSSYSHQAFLTPPVGVQWRAERRPRLGRSRWTRIFRRLRCGFCPPADQTRPEESNRHIHNLHTMWGLVVMATMAAASVPGSEETRPGAQTSLVRRSQRVCEQLDWSFRLVPLNISSSSRCL